MDKASYDEWHNGAKLYYEKNILQSHQANKTKYLELFSVTTS
jgi:hypothetical protein